jgi:transposase-like protein
MSKRIFSEGELETLRNNPNVAKCSSKSITFSKDFKLKAVKTYYEDGQSANIIFRQAGFDLAVIGRTTPKFRLRDWKKIYKTKGETALNTESRGRGGGRRSKQDDDVEYLQAKIAYLEAENSFLKKLKTKNKT